MDSSSCVLGQRAAAFMAVTALATAVSGIVAGDVWRVKIAANDLPLGGEDVRPLCRRDEEVGAAVHHVGDDPL